MKRMLMLGVLIIWHGSAALAQDISWRVDGGMPQYGSIEVKGSDESSGFRAGIDNSPSLKAVNLTIKKSENSRLAFGFIDKKELIKRGTAFKARYEIDLSVASGSAWDISDEAKAAAGYLSSKYEFPSGRSMAGGEFTHMLFGMSNYLKGEFRVGDSKTVLKVGGDSTGSQMSDTWGSLTEWDNHGVGAEGLFEVPISGAKFRAEGGIRRVKYNPNRYFFVLDWTEDYRARTELTVPLDQWRFIPSIEYRRLDVERDRLVDLERPEYGFAVVRKNLFGSKTDGFLKGIYSPWLHKRGKETLVAIGANSGSASGEIYQREIVDQYSSFNLKERIVGVRLSWKFGEAEKEIRKGIEKYGSVVDDKYAFYREGDSVADNKSLTLGQQAERLKNARRRVEWSGSSLKWISAPTTGVGFRYPDETYAGRAGDCDEQSCMNNRIDRLNGYESYSAAYWDPGSSVFVGHAVGVFKDPTNNQWFLDEYGVAFKIRGLGPNATKEQAMRTGILQNSRFLALGISNPQLAYFTTWDCYDPNSPGMIFQYFGDAPAEKGRPSIERGVELFTKRGFLFE